MKNTAKNIKGGIGIHERQNHGFLKINTKSSLNQSSMICGWIKTEKSDGLSGKWWNEDQNILEECRNDNFDV